MDIHFRSSTVLVSLCAALVMTTIAQAQQSQCPEYGYGPHGMWHQLTPEQRQMMWENMHRSGYGPGMMGPGYGHGMMMGPGYGHGMMMGPGYGPGMMGPGYGHGTMMGPGYGPGMMGPGYGHGMMYRLTPEQRQQIWEIMQRGGNGPDGQPQAPVPPTASPEK